MFCTEHYHKLASRGTESDKIILLVDDCQPEKSQLSKNDKFSVEKLMNK